MEIILPGSGLLENIVEVFGRLRAVACLSSDSRLFCSGTL